MRPEASYNRLADPIRTARLKMSEANSVLTSSATEPTRPAGVGQTEEDQGTSERDADGRKMWEGRPDGQSQEQGKDEHNNQQQHKSKDPTGNAGNSLDLTG